ncbi:lipid A-modifier LpxR family protein [uncultured Croceitalea sp.]|uniref:lipid A-modifier LpxR family protein n=1 Tax=uncultured Croceitalea sp. TaxID=1798908 RepID=UPI00374F03F0
MFNKPVLFLSLFILLLLFVVPFYAQDTSQKILNQQLELRHDNDFFLLTDRYYSSGLFLTYRKLLSKGIFKDHKEQLDFTLGQEVYTPSQTQSTNIDVFDRPYAGFSGLKTSWSLSFEKKQLIKTTILIGIAGLNSGAGGFQRWYHQAIAIAESPLWIGEISDSFHLNAYFNYVKEWKIAPEPFGVHFAVKPNIAFGSRDIYIEPETIFFFGRRNVIDNSIAYDRLGSTNREIYFALRASYRNVFYNGLIEGNLFGDNSPVVKDPVTGVWRFGFDFYHRFQRNDYKFGIRYNSSETEPAKGHKYIILSYGLSF